MDVTFFPNGNENQRYTVIKCTMKKEYLEAGKIVTTHGIRGEVKIMPYTDSPELLAEFDRLFIGKNHEEVFIERSRVFKNTVIAKIEGVDTPEAAEKLRNKVLYMHRDDLELDEDTYFIQDLIGLEVRDADNDKGLRQDSRRYADRRKRCLRHKGRR